MTAERAKRTEREFDQRKAVRFTDGFVLAFGLSYLYFRFAEQRQVLVKNIKQISPNILQKRRAA